MATNTHLLNCPPLRFPEFNDEWQQTSLGEIGVYIKGLTYTTDDVQEEGKTIVVRANNLTNGSPIDFNTNLVKVVIKPSVAQLLKKNDLAICMANGSSHLVGKVSYYNGNYSGSITIGAFCGIFRSNNVLVRWILQSTTYRRYIYQSLQGGDGAIANLKGDDILSQHYFLPSFAEQKKIAEFLSLIDERIETQRQVIKERKKQKTALLQQLFSQSLRFPSFSEEWQTTTLGEIVVCLSSNLTEASLYALGVTPIFGANGLCGFGDIDKPLSESILIVKDGSGVGRVQYKEDSHYFLATLNSLKIKSEANDQKYVYYFLERFDFKKYISGSGIPHIYFSDYSKASIPLPSFAEQEKIADFLTKVDERIELEEELLKQYERQKRYLLKEMFI